MSDLTLTEVEKVTSKLVNHRVNSQCCGCLSDTFSHVRVVSAFL